MKLALHEAYAHTQAIYVVTSYLLICVLSKMADDQLPAGWEKRLSRSTGLFNKNFHITSVITPMKINTFRFESLMVMGVET